MKKPLKISINKEWAKKVGKAKFVSQLEKAYPDVDLGSDIDKIVPPNEEKFKKD